MPCRSDGYPSENQHNHLVCKERIDQLTQLLCYACGELRDLDMLNMSEVDGRLIEWAEQHHDNDSRRVHQEMTHDIHKYSSAGRMAAAYIKKADKVHPVSDWHRQWFKDLASQVWEENIEVIDEEQRIEQLREMALAILSDEEKESLGL